MRAHIRKAPKRAGDGLFAHLFRYGDVIGLGLAVGVVRSDAHPHLPAPLRQHKLDLAAGGCAGGLDHRIGRHARSRHAVIDRRAGRAGDSQLLKLANMFFERLTVAARPPCDNRLPHANLRSPGAWSFVKNDLHLASGA